MASMVGKITRTCFSIALQDFYQQHTNTTTIIVPNFRDSKQDNVQAASAAIDLLKNLQVIAIFGPMKSSQADFVTDIGNKSKVPIISPATTPSLSPNRNPYFIRSAPNSSANIEPITQFIKSFAWKQVVFVYEDGDYGTSFIPCLSDAMLTIGAKVMYRSIVSPSASDDWILQELYKLKTMQTRVFVVHTLPALASRFFKKVNEAGMMEKGYVWIITEVVTSQLHTLDIDSMQGVIGVKSFIPRSYRLINFEKRWKTRFRSQNPEVDVIAPDMFGIWSYDTVFALAMAFEKVASDQIDMTFHREMKSSTTDLDAIGTSEMGPKLLPWIRNLRFEGLSGNFHIVDGQLQSYVYQIVNIIGKGEKPIGYWTPGNAISKTLKLTTNKQLKDELGAITWPGDTHLIPKGWEIPTSNENKLRVGVPAKGGFVQFIDANFDPQTKKVVATGFCVDVFKAVVDALPYAVRSEFIPFVTPDGTRPAGSYNDLVYEVFRGKYDAVVGDITILANRSEYVDFTLPYTEAGVSMIVPIKVDERTSAWIFTRPLERDLWITTGVFFIYTGVVVWILEHRVNKEFRGPPHQQVGTIFWFSLSTLVFAHKEKLKSNLSRFVVAVWVFVVLVLTSSYTASLTSMLTVQQLQPLYTDIHEIMRNGESVGYQDGSFVAGMLIGMGFDGSKLKSYSTFEEYDNALQIGSKNGGVSAIMDELPYIRVFLAKYLLQVTEEQMRNISNQWFGGAAGCDEQKGAKVTSDSLTLDSFKGPFLIAGLSSTSALIIFLLMFLYENREKLMSEGSISQKLAAIAKTFDNESRKTKEVVDIDKSPAISVYHQEAVVFCHDEGGSSTTEPGTPLTAIET
ncbi:Extracellular ligand-binding receptor [Cynara cardunculus var. scolymus]|uniref:Glutamate receptor n=1 Tax=Cynara cardunculus var. scolymus TaxID=59895 RepID=A0A103XLB2_CYNCS|nr:Extracellular ligand-binding receptor [Cynara cardunculus var. scolymus]